MKKKKIHKTNAMRILDREKISYTVHEYPWSEEHLDAKSAAEKTGMPYEKIYKTLVAVGDKTGVVVACVPSEAEVDLKALARVSGNKRAEMLAMKDLEKTTGYIRGGCSPLGMTKQYPTYIEQSAAALDAMVVSAGKRGMQVELAPDDLQQATGAEFAAFAVKQ